MRKPSDELNVLRQKLSKLKPRNRLKGHVDLKGRQLAYHAASGLGIAIRALCTPDTQALDLGMRKFEIERIR